MQKELDFGTHVAHYYHNQVHEMCNASHEPAHWSVHPVLYFFTPGEFQPLLDIVIQILYSLRVILTCIIVCVLVSGSTRIAFCLLRVAVWSADLALHLVPVAAVTVLACTTVLFVCSCPACFALPMVTTNLREKHA